MKQRLLVILVLALLALSLFSCRSTHDCPAYSENNQEQIEHNS
ncbi:MAG: hypothetical protein PHE08_06170 [Bacteroidales bacterium]|nr:hypothetical protein [Bacteroidales bacterium]